MTKNNNVAGLLLLMIVFSTYLDLQFIRLSVWCWKVRHYVKYINEFHPIIIGACVTRQVDMT
jgi:hypothetical protein